VAAKRNKINVLDLKFITVLGDRYEVLHLQEWEIKSIFDGYTQMIISRYKLEKDIYTFENLDKISFKFEIGETSPAKLCMLTDMDAYFCGLANLNELKQVLNTKYKNISEKDIIWVQKIKRLS
jgi:hypothetical protein